MPMRCLTDRQVKTIIADNGLEDVELLLKYIHDNSSNNSIHDLSRIAELANSTRDNDGAYYTDDSTLELIHENLPVRTKGPLRILEPSVGVGNFIPMIVSKFVKMERVIIDVCDINPSSLKICKALNKKRDIPQNVKINYLVGDFLSMKFQCHYDYIIGNPPFLRLNKKNGLGKYQKILCDTSAKNTAAFFMEKAIRISDYVSLIMPKIFLSNADYQVCRERTSKYNIETILDFGEKGFRGVLVETICLFIDTNSAPSKTNCISVTRNINNFIQQAKLTDPKYPNWLLYRNSFFDSIARKMYFNIFSVVRDRQITNSITNHQEGIWVIKSGNIERDGSKISHKPGYDIFLSESDLSKIYVSKYYHSDDVYLSPNMTYYPRVIRKPKNTLTNGSVAIFILKDKSIKVSNNDLQYFASDEFEKFYEIARNYSTRTLNIDKNSIFYFGIVKGAKDDNNTRN